MKRKYKRQIKYQGNYEIIIRVIDKKEKFDERIKLFLIKDKAKIKTEVQE
jgi:hypothetical protein